MHTFRSLWCWLLSETSWRGGCRSQKAPSCPPSPPFLTSPVCKRGVTVLHPGLGLLQSHSADSLKQSRIWGYSDPWLFPEGLFTFIGAMVYIKWEAGLWPQGNHSFLPSSSWGRTVGCGAQRVVMSLATMAECLCASCLSPVTGVVFVNAGVPSVMVSSRSEEPKNPSGLLYTCKWQISV